MSVTTTADEKISIAKDSLNDAYKAILTALDPDTCGHSEFNEEYIENLHLIALDIVKIKSKL